MAGDILSTHAVRLGFRQIKGFSEDDAKRLVVGRGRGYDSIRDLWLRSGLGRAAIERLADADAFRSLGLDRRDALWAARELGGGASAPGGKDGRLPLFDTPEHADIRREPDLALPPMPIGEHVVNDYRFLSLSLKAHPVSFLRDRLTAKAIVSSESLRTIQNGRRVTVAGLVLVRQRPGSASGVIFMTLEDETDIANAIVWPKVFERFRPVVLGARLTAVTGRVQSESGVIHVVAERLDDLTPMLAALSKDAGDLEALARADEVRRPGTAAGVIFMTLEDETDIANIIVWPKIFAKNRRTVMTARFLAVRGRLQRAGLVIHVIAESFVDLSAELPSLRDGDLFSQDFSAPPRPEDAPLPLKSRNFH